MIIKSIIFQSDRTPVPQRIKIGFETDNRVVQLALTLPRLHDQQTAMFMLSGRYPNMVKLEERSGRYVVDLSAELIGAAGEVEAYATINTPDGRVWNSAPFVLITGDLPDVDGYLQEHFPDAIEQMRQDIAAHRADMAEEITLVSAAADRAETAAESVTVILDGGENGQVLTKKDGQTVWADPASGPGGTITNEIDPTVPSWAKEPNKPEYTADEVGAQPAGDYAFRSELPNVPVQSVNGQTGAVKLTAADIKHADYKCVHRLSL